MRVLLLGAGGMLGSDLASTAPAMVDLQPATRAQLDITDHSSLTAVLNRLRPQVVINAAAFSAVDRAEIERDAALAVNAGAVSALARACAARDIALVHFSTDYVFDGAGTRPYREDDPVAPVNAYGATKLAGEQGIITSGATALVIRTQWLFGASGRSFSRTMWERARREQPTRAVMDQCGRPTFTVDLAAATWQLVAAGAKGVFHAANAGQATWYDLASRVFSAAGVSELLTPCTTAEYPTPARRPSYSVLDTARLERTLGAALPAWTNALARFLTMLERSAGAAGTPPTS